LNTPYKTIFDAFLAKIDSYEIGDLEDIVAEYDMTGLMNSGMVYFRLPKVNIWDKDDELKTFNVELSYEEIQIISRLMVAEWFKRMVYNTDTLIQKFGETDFEFKSQANHLKAQVEAWKEIVDSDVKTLLSNYSRSYQGEIFNYKLLAGKK